MLPDSLQWSLFRRRSLSKSIKGFQADFFTYATADSNFAEYVSLHRKSCIFSSSLGRATYVAGATLGNVATGNYCSIGQGARVGMGQHPTNFLSTHPAFYSAGGQTQLQIKRSTTFKESSPVSIGNDVWIGANSIVMDGVSVGDGAIIGAGAIVTRDVPAYAVAVGSPAKVIKFRFDTTTIDLLKSSQWWNLSETDVSLFFDEVSPSGPVNQQALEQWLLKARKAS